MKLVGIVLVILGIVGLVYGGMTWTTRENVVNLGPLQVTHDKTQSLPLPLIARRMPDRRRRSLGHGRPPEA
jgi:hypothetical protein